MKKSRTRTRLSVGRETIRELSTFDLGRAVGAIDNSEANCLAAKAVAVRPDNTEDNCVAA
jgi:hypothetical protein